MATSVYKDEKENVFKAVFYKEEPFKQHVNLGQYKTKELAIKAVCDAEIEFYSKNTYLLPKGIIIVDKTFQLRVLANLIHGEKPRVIASAKTLSEIKDKKKFILESLIY